MNTLMQDARYAMRMLAKAPGFTAIAVLTLALGIGANTAIFSVVNAVLLRPLPFRDSARLVDIWSSSTLFDFPNLGSSLPDLADLRKQTTAFSEFAEYEWVSEMAMTGRGEAKDVNAAQISEEFFPVLGLRPIYGRLFLDSEMKAGQDREAILSYSLWRKEFGGDAKAVGKSVTLDGKAYTIVGVMPDVPEMNFPTSMDLWTPLDPSDKELADRGNHDADAIARWKPGVTPAEAQAQIATLNARLAKAYPKEDGGWSMRAAPVQKDLLGDTRTPLLILFGAVGFVLLIACANVGNLFLARGWSRRRELAIRATLGATRGRIVRQLLIESLLMALAGGTAGFLLARWGVTGLKTFVPPNTPRIDSLRVDGWVFFFTLGASLLAGILFGLAPAVLSSRQELTSMMKEGGGGTQTGATGARQQWLRQLLVVGEVALALTLVIGAALALRSFSRVLEVNLGFQPEHLLTMQVDTPKFQFANAGQQAQFAQQVLERVRAMAGVESAAVDPFPPFSGWGGETTFRVEGETKSKNPNGDEADVDEPTPGYFRALGIPLLAGRGFTDADVKSVADVYVVNEALAKKYFGGKNPVGQRITTGAWDSKTPVKWGEIVGVVGDTRNQDAKAAPKPELYRPLLQEDKNVWGQETLLVRTRGNPLAMASAIEEQVRAVNNVLPITQARTMGESIAETNAPARFRALLLGIFGGLGLLLAVVGIYGVISYSVSQRTHEIGVRMALGAEPRQVMRLVLAQGLKLTLIGVAAGIAASLALTRLMASLLFGVSATDPLTFAGVAVALVAVALAACWIPARRAMRVDPMEALRYE